MQRIVIIDGDYWPAGDTECRPAVMKQYKDADEAIAVCRGKNVVVQAGGNCGIWARYLSNIFKTVYTFEPDADNFLCLNMNAQAKNIIKMQVALGIPMPPIRMKTTPSNVGAHSVDGTEYYRVGGDIPVISIDSLQLQACDFLQLDLEGYEHFALKGAYKTIKKFRPVLMIEDKGHHTKYGVAENAMQDLLASYGYRLLKKVHRDIIMVPAEWGAL